MENALQNTKFLNFSRKTQTCIYDCKTPSLSKNSPVPSPTKRKIEGAQRKTQTQQRVLLWFLSKGIKRAEPSLIYDEFKQVQRKKIVEGRENLRPKDDSRDRKDNISLLNRRMMRRLTLQL